MDLRTYRKQQGWTLERAAHFADFSDGSVWRRYETGERWPEPFAMETIETLTGGLVTASDMLKTRRAWERAQLEAVRTRSRERERELVLAEKREPFDTTQRKASNG